MKKQQVFLLLFITLFLISFISAAEVITLITPADNEETNTTTQLLNATLDSNDGTVTNVSFYYRPVSGTGAWTLIANIANDTATQTGFNTTWNTTAFIDAVNYELNATASNSTGSHESSDNSTGVKIDNDDPTAAWSTASIASGTKIGSGASFTIALNADNTIGISNCTVYLNSNTQTIDGSGNACSQAFTTSTFSITDTGVYNLIVTATDANSDQTNSSTRTIEVTIGAGGSSPSTTTPDEDIPDEVIGDEVTPTRKNAVVRAMTNAMNRIREFFSRIFQRWF